MAATFVASSAPNGWQLGQWTQTSNTQWQECKINDPNTVYTFEVVAGQSGSSAVPLRMMGANGAATGTEAIISDNSVQIFVDAQYLGTYSGQWAQGQPGGQAKRGSAPMQGNQRGAAPMQGNPAPMGRPSEVAQQGGAAPGPMRTMPPAAQAGPGAVAYPQAAGRSAVSQVSRAPEPPRSRKAENLDTSSKSAEQLVHAARSGDTASVQRLLAAAVDPDCATRDGTTPLLAASGQGHLKVVELLLGAGADANIGKDGVNPMTVAFQKGHQDILKVLFGAAFQSLDTAVGPGALLSPTGGIRAAAAGDQEISGAAISELRDVTAKLASLGGGTQRPGVPLSAGDDYQDAPPGGADMDVLRENAVKDAMKLISASNK